MLDEVQHLCVPPEVIHQLLERDALLSAEEHLELYDSPIVLDLDAGESPPPPILILISRDAAHSVG